ncbi:MAG: DUF481 domain-containing protein [Rubripirellula sp.]
MALDSAPYTVPVDPTSKLPSTGSYSLPSDTTPSLQLSPPSGDVSGMILPPQNSDVPAGSMPTDFEFDEEANRVPSAELAMPSGNDDQDPGDSTLDDLTSGSVEPLDVDQPYDRLPLPDAEQNAPVETPEPLDDLAEQVNGGDSAEPAPLQSEVIRWYQYPQRWMRGWDSHAEFGLDGSDGNANTLAIQTGMELKRKTEAYTLGIDVNYRQASSRNQTTEENGRLNVDYDRLLGDTSWSAFGKYGMEWDRFKAFDLRLNLNGGLGYYWVRSDDATLATRFGAGASREIGAPEDDWIPEAVFGLEAERQLTARQKLKGKIDYFPAWEDFGDYRLVSDVAWEILLDGSENLSLKLAATDRYDSTPQGARPNDVYYSLLLLYKF